MSKTEYHSDDEERAVLLLRLMGVPLPTIAGKPYLEECQEVRRLHWIHILKYVYDKTGVLL